MHLRLALQTGSKFINNNIEICLKPIMFIEFSKKKLSILINTHFLLGSSVNFPSLCRNHSIVFLIIKNMDINILFYLQFQLFG